MENVYNKIYKNKYVDLIGRYALYGEYGYYISPYIIHFICSDNLRLPFSRIRDYVNSVELKLTGYEIVTFLKEKEKEDNKDKPKISRSNNSKSQEFADNFMKKLTASTYELNSTTLDYFNMYINNLKQNTINLIDLVNNIGIDDYKELFDSLDIKILNGEIYYDDAIRLCKPIIYNVLKLREMEKKANSLETYLSFSVNNDYLRSKGITLSDICPTVSYQVPYFETMSEDGYIELSDNQKKQMLDDNIKSYSLMLKQLKSL